MNIKRLAALVFGAFMQTTAAMEGHDWHDESDYRVPTRHVQLSIILPAEHEAKMNACLAVSPVTVIDSSNKAHNLNLTWEMIGVTAAGDKIWNLTVNSRVSQSAEHVLIFDRDGELISVDDVHLKAIRFYCDWRNGATSELTIHFSRFTSPSGKEYRGMRCFGNRYIPDPTLIGSASHS